MPVQRRQTGLVGAFVSTFISVFTPSSSQMKPKFSTRDCRSAVCSAARERREGFAAPRRHLVYHAQKSYVIIRRNFFKGFGRRSAIPRLNTMPWRAAGVPTLARRRQNTNRHSLRQLFLPASRPAKIDFRTRSSPVCAILNHRFGVPEECLPKDPRYYRKVASAWTLSSNCVP